MFGERHWTCSAMGLCKTIDDLESLKILMKQTGLVRGSEWYISFEWEEVVFNFISFSEYSRSFAEL